MKRVYCSQDLAQVRQLGYARVAAVADRDVALAARLPAAPSCNGELRLPERLVRVWLPAGHPTSGAAVIVRSEDRLAFLARQAPRGLAAVAGVPDRAPHYGEALLVRAEGDVVPTRVNHPAVISQVPHTTIDLSNTWERSAQLLLREDVPLADLREKPERGTLHGAARVGPPVQKCHDPDRLIARIPDRCRRAQRTARVGRRDEGAHVASVPANAADVEAVVAERLRALSTSLEAKQTATIEWRGRQTYVQVIDMPVNLVSYNPDTHRIRSQRSLDSSREAALESDPFGQTAQGYLHHLLRGNPQDPAQEDPTFAALKESLAEHGQEEPGIITRAGVLVNGNTRCAALRELGREHIRVGVLPEDTGDEDIRAIELSLQLRKEYKRDYSFVNFLLAVDERVSAGRPTAEILSDFRMRQATLDRSLWILDLIREAIDRSRHEAEDGSTVQLRLIDFESHQGKLEELHRAYVALKQRDPDAAEALREQRLLALVLEKSKTDLRLIEPHFTKTYLPERLPPSETGESVAKFIPGTSVPLAQPAAGVKQLRELTDNILRAKATVVAAADRSLRTEVASKTLQDVGEAVDDALNKAGRNARLKKRQVAPADRITDAVEDLNLAVAAISEARSGATFSASDVEDALTELRSAVEKLAQQVNLSRDSESGDGVEWLLHVAVADV